jgi:hypothetical protein
MKVSQLKEQIRRIIREKMFNEARGGRIPKLFLKIEAVKKEIDRLTSERKSKFGGEYAKKFNAEKDPKKREQLTQPILVISKKITELQKNLLNLYAMEEKYIQDLDKDAELELEIKEAITNPKKSNPNDLATTVIGWYDFATDYIDDGGQRRRAIKSNEDVVNWFDSHPSDVKQKAFKVMLSKQPSIKSKIERVFGSSLKESVNEAKTYKKGDKLKIKLPNGKKFDVVFDMYSRTKGVALGKFKDGSGEYNIKPFNLDTIVESVINEDTRRVKLLGIDFKVSEMNGRIFFSFVDKKAASVSLRQVGTNKIVNHIQNRLDIAYGKGTFFFKSGDHAEFQNGYLFQRNTPDINLNKLKFESVNEAAGKLSISQLPFKFLFNYPIAHTSTPGNFQDWYRDGMKLKKGRIEKFSPEDDKQLRSLINIWWDEVDDVPMADFHNGRDSKEIKKVKKDILDFLIKKSKVISESVNESVNFNGYVSSTDGKTFTLYNSDKKKIKDVSFDDLKNKYMKTYLGQKLKDFKDSFDKTTSKGKYWQYWKGKLVNVKLSNIDESINEATEPEIISQLKDIVKNKQYKMIKDPKTGKSLGVDMQTANAVLQIYDGLSNVNKDNMVKMGLPKMIDVSFKIINKYKK